MADLDFSVPAVCADRLEAGLADVGIVPCAELARMNLIPLLDVGIACRGAVRSILLISKVAPSSIQTLAADTSSRTSVQLARVILQERYGVRPSIRRENPDLPTMLTGADAALIIGDPALHLVPETLPYHVLDLGSEWMAHTGLPMVFAVWAGRQKFGDDVRRCFQSSCEFGLSHISEIIDAGAKDRGLPQALVNEYLTRHIRFHLDDEAKEGMNLFAKTIRSL